MDLINSKYFRTYFFGHSVLINMKIILWEINYSLTLNKVVQMYCGMYYTELLLCNRRDLVIQHCPQKKKKKKN